MTILDLVASLRLDTGEYERGLDDAEKSAGSFGAKLRSGLGTVAKVGGGLITLASGAAVAFGKSSVAAGMQFDSAMARVAATSGKSVDELGELRDFALEMGRTTTFSATEAAQALNYMALAGYDTEKSMATLPSVLNLAASGGMDLARASDIITDAETALGLKTGEVDVLVAQMAKTASTTNTSVEQLGDALLTVGGTAQFMSGGITEINSVLGVLANSGIKGSEAGTKLRNIILKLSSPTSKGAAALDNLGVKVFDAEGKMRSFTEIFPDLQNALEQLTDEQQIEALSKIFNVRDVAAATALMHTSAEEWESISGAIEQSQGAAEKMANTQLDNLAGQMTLFRSALEGARIAISDRLTPTLRDFMGLATDGLSQVTGAFQEGGLTAAMEQFGSFLSQVLDKVIGALPSIIDAGIRLVGALVQGIFDNSDKIFDAAEQIITMLVEYLVNNAETIIGGVIQLISKLASRLPGLIMPIVRALPRLLRSIARGLINNLPALIEGVVELVNGIVTDLPVIVTELIAAIPDIVKMLFDPENLSKMIGILVEGAFNLVAGLVSNLPTIIVNLLEAIPGIIDSIVGQFGPLGEILSTLFGGFAETVGNVLGGISDVVGPALTEAGNVAKGIFNWMGTLMTDPAQALKDAFNGVKDYALKVWESLKSIVSGIFDFIEAKRAEAEAKANREKTSAALEADIASGKLKAETNAQGTHDFTDEYVAYLTAKGLLGSGAATISSDATWEEWKAGAVGGVVDQAPTTVKHEFDPMEVDVIGLDKDDKEVFRQVNKIITNQVSNDIRMGK